jgi:hypothetical protein
VSDSKSNIKFNYLYRDAGNYKIYGYEIFSNPQSAQLAEIERKIRSLLIDGEFFDPQHWKVKRLKHDDWIPELDHTWNEYESVEYTDEVPTMTLVINQFLELISKIPKY